MHRLSSNFEQSFLVKNNLVCIFFRNKYGYQIGNAVEKKTLFWQGWNAQNGLILYINRFLDMLIPMTQVLRLYIQMFLTYGLYVCIILETAPHRTTFRIFCNIIQKTMPEENVQYFFNNCIFSYGKVKDIFGIRFKFHLGRAKGWHKRGYGERPKMRCFLAKFHY